MHVIQLCASYTLVISAVIVCITIVCSQCWYLMLLHSMNSHIGISQVVLTLEVSDHMGDKRWLMCVYGIMKVPFCFILSPFVAHM